MLRKRERHLLRKRRKRRRRTVTPKVTQVTTQKVAQKVTLTAALMMNLITKLKSHPRKLHLKLLAHLPQLALLPKHPTVLHLNRPHPGLSSPRILLQRAELSKVNPKRPKNRLLTRMLQLKKTHQLKKATPQLKKWHLSMNSQTIT